MTHYAGAEIRRASASQSGGDYVNVASWWFCAMSGGDQLTLPLGEVSLATHPVTYQTDWFAYIRGCLVGQQSSSGYRNMEILDLGKLLALLEGQKIHSQD